MTSRLLVAVGMLMELCYLTFYFCTEGPGEVLLFIAVNAVTYLLLSFLVWRLRRATSGVESGPGAILLIVLFGLLFRLSLVPHAVVGSDDIYRYLWDGRVAASGTNPYAYVPTDPHLAQLATADLPAKVNHQDLRTVYPALAQGLFFLAHIIFGDSATGLKFLLVMIDCLTMALLWRLLRQRGNAPLALLLYAWSPLPVLYFGLDGHIDALGIPFLILSLVFFCTNRPVRGALALGLSALAKLVPLLVVPLLVKENKGIRRVLLPAIPPLMVAIGSALYYEPTWGIVESLKTFSARWEFNGSLFSVAYFLTGSNEVAHIISGVMILGSIGILALLERPFLEKVFWGVVSFFLLAPVVHPWYLTWVAPLLAVRWSTAVYVFLGLSCIANVVVYQYRAFGLWIDQPVLLLLEYVPVAVLLAREFARKEVLRSGEGR